MELTLNTHDITSAILLGESLKAGSTAKFERCEDHSFNLVFDESRSIAIVATGQLNAQHTASKYGLDYRECTLVFFAHQVCGMSPENTRLIISDCISWRDVTLFDALRARGFKNLHQRGIVCG